jgi:hypothetical protein
MLMVQEVNILSWMQIDMDKIMWMHDQEVSVMDKLIYSELFALRLEEVLLMGTSPIVSLLATTVFKFTAG